MGCVSAIMSESEQADMGTEMTAEVSTVLDRAQLRNITMDDDCLAREIVVALVDDASRQITLLHDAIRQGRADECVRLAHSARGACGNVGAASLAALFSSLESEAQRGDLSRCGEKIRHLAVELEKLREEATTI